MAPQPGFREAIVAKYLGDTSRHTIMRFWEDEDAYQAFRATPDGNYGRNRPEGLYVNERVITPLVSYGEGVGPAQGNFLVKVERAVPAEARDAFMDQQKGMMAMASSLPGLVWARQLRTKDGEGVTTVARFRSREDLENMVESPQYGESLKAIPEGVNLVRIECFEVVSDVAPKK
jgi:heme-degrading monooxygenase HmoA